MSRPVIGVMGGGDVAADVWALAERLGGLIASKGWILLNGGRNTGVMAASARGAKRAGGTVVGVLPDRDCRGASADLDIAIVTGMGDGRNVINVLSSDVVIACPGGAGTLSEISLSLKNGKPVILLGWTDASWVEHFGASGRIARAASPEEAIQIAEDALARR